MPIKNVNKMFKVELPYENSLLNVVGVQTACVNYCPIWHYEVNILLTFFIGIYISPHISETRGDPNLKLADPGS